MNYGMELWAAPAALGFAVLFNVRRRALLPIAAVAVLAHLVRGLLLELGGSLVGASFVAALVVGGVAFLIGPLLGEARPVLAFAPVIPLVPGSYIFAAIREVVHWLGLGSTGEEATRSFTLAASQAMAAGWTTLALAVGAIAPLLLLPRARRAD